MWVVVVDVRGGLVQILVVLVWRWANELFYTENEKEYLWKHTEMKCPPRTIKCKMDHRTEHTMLQAFAYCEMIVCLSCCWSTINTAQSNPTPYQLRTVALKHSAASQTTNKHTYTSSTNPLSPGSSILIRHSIHMLVVVVVGRPTLPPFHTINGSISIWRRGRDVRHSPRMEYMYVVDEYVLCAFDIKSPLCFDDDDVITNANTFSYIIRKSGA